MKTAPSDKQTFQNLGILFSRRPGLAVTSYQILLSKVPCCLVCISESWTHNRVFIVELKIEKERCKDAPKQMLLAFTRVLQTQASVQKVSLGGLKDQSLSSGLSQFGKQMFTWTNVKWTVQDDRNRTRQFSFRTGFPSKSPTKSESFPRFPFALNSSCTLHLRFCSLKTSLKFSYA